MPEPISAYAVLVTPDGREISQRALGEIHVHQTGPRYAEVSFVAAAPPLVLDVTARSVAKVHYCRASTGIPVFCSRSWDLMVGDKVSFPEVSADA